MKKLFWLQLVLAFMLCISLTAQNNDSIPANNNAAADMQNETSASSPQIVKIFSNRKSNPNQVPLNEYITVQVSNVQDLVENHLNQDFYLVMDHYRFSDITAITIESPEDNLTEFTFHLSNDDSTMVTFFREKYHIFDAHTGPTYINIGYEENGNSQDIAETPYKFRLIFYNKIILTLGRIFSFGVIFLVIILGIKSDLLKDLSSADVRPYSFSRVQFAWWTVIILYSFLYIYALHEELDIFSQSSLILLGISVATTVTGSVIDTSQMDEPKVKRHQDYASKSFLHDILSDHGGINIHRFQNFIFNIVFGVIFFYRVVQDVQMPNFGNLELVLMGVSSSTYLSLKVTENQAGNAEKMSKSSADESGVESSDDEDAESS